MPSTQYPQQRAINHFCMDCKGGDGWLVGNCEKTDCPLFEFRPNKALRGTSRDVEAEADIINHVNSQLDMFDEINTIDESLALI